MGARVSNGHPGIAALMLLVAGLGRAGLRAMAGRGAGSRAPDGPPASRAGLHASTAVAALAAAAAALVVIGDAAGRRLGRGPGAGAWPAAPRCSR